ncbi:MAG TPA: tyrosine-type recombinase/integrase, partial [Acidobacteriaceae bacterium]|nr:tyrosine-type recombinase/integrase [Acidobacteriaceae bacterium]
SNRTINMEVATCRQILKRHKLWNTISDDVKMLPEDKTLGKPLANDEAVRLREACRKSPSPSFYPAMVIFGNTALRNAELREARWYQVDFLGAKFQVDKAKTAGGSGRVIPLNRTALDAFRQLRSRWPDAQPTDFIFPSEKLKFQGKGAAQRARGTRPDGRRRRRPVRSGASMTGATMSSPCSQRRRHQRPRSRH